MQTATLVGWLQRRHKIGGRSFRGENYGTGYFLIALLLVATLNDGPTS
jgi:hypothetical protein